jgi:hypothetical protein
VHTPRSLPTIAAPLLVVVAVFGYVAGHRRAVAPSTQGTRIASGTSIVLEYPASWQPVHGAPAIPGLSISSPLALAPGGDYAHAGLLSGKLGGGESSPLPSSFLALLRGVPRTEVVELLDVQAYRYSDLRIAGYEPTLELYAIPHPGDRPTALACYAAKGFTSELHQCEQIVLTLTLVGQSSSDDLSPDTGYARRLGTVVAALDSERLKLRREMRLSATPAALGALATSLAGRFAAAATSLGALEPPLVAASAQDALSKSIRSARDAYTALAAAGGGAGGGEAAKARVGEAEGKVDAALEGFALLGYAHS